MAKKAASEGSAIQFVPSSVNFNSTDNAFLTIAVKGTADLIGKEVTLSGGISDNNRISTNNNTGLISIGYIGTRPEAQTTDKKYTVTGTTKTSDGQTVTATFEIINVPTDQPDGEVVKDTSVKIRSEIE